MRKLFLFTFLYLISCSILDDNVSCENGHGYLLKGKMEFECPFTIQQMTARDGHIEWIDYYEEVTVFDSNVESYEPFKHRNTPYTYRLKMKVLKEYFTEEKYIMSLWTVDKNFKVCGESREFIFYKVTESADSVEYNSQVAIDGIGYGKYVFFSEIEMPSYDWYHVLNIGKCESFHIKGEVVE